MEQDEGYGNTPLHIACNLHSYAIIKRIMEAGADRDIKNLEGKTTKNVVEDEIARYKGHIEGQEKDLTLERLSVIKALFE
jgi:ankyrin repeat protein